MTNTRRQNAPALSSRLKTQPSKNLKKRLVVTPAFLKRLDTLERPARGDAWLALLEFTDHFGKPHSHGGIGIRKLEGNIFECRAGLSLRLVIRNTPDALIVHFIGTHDEIRRWVRDL